jgi:hypothetical protein
LSEFGPATIAGPMAMRAGLRQQSKLCLAGFSRFFQREISPVKFVDTSQKSCENAFEANLDV